MSPLHLDHSDTVMYVIPVGQLYVCILYSVDRQPSFWIFFSV